VGTRSYGISNPKFWPAIVLLVVAYAAFLVIMLLRADPDEWQILVVPTLPLLPLAYILHRCSLSWIRIKDEEVEIVPSWFRRKFWGEQSKNARFDSGSELLFCQRFACGAFDGYFILLRSRSGTDLTMWSTVNHSTGAGRRWWSRIAQEISDTCHLNTRLIEQTVSSQGTQEADWPTGSGKKLWRLRALILPALAPWLGIGARVLTADSLKLVGTGVLLWIGCAGLMLHWIQSRRGTLRWQDLSTGMLVFTLQFATFYTLTVLVTGAVLHR
jgi:hypothetical protein